MEMSGLRDKDRELAKVCAQVAQASVEGVAWFSAHRAPTAHRATIQRQLRRDAVDARRLAVAATRPMSVGVFGASQMGKSFLIGKLISPQNNPTKVVFGNGDNAVRQDFLTQVNPAGGDETTGLVTRFTMRKFETPAGFPVILRALREVDIIKILANTFLFDLGGLYRIKTGEESEDFTLTEDRLAALSTRINEKTDQAAQSGMTLEDVYELRDYVESHLERHLLSPKDVPGYWQLLEEKLPVLSARDRADLLSPLWAELREFTDLYTTLKDALDQMGHPEHIFTGLGALEDRSRGVLHVKTLGDLDSKHSGTMLEVSTKDGRRFSLPICVVTAITAELCVTLDHEPWPFFAHTDLLDFPGARSREDKTVHGYLRNPAEATARSNCYLRGKVSVLFDNYADDLDLNVMLLCAGPENQEVKSLPGLVSKWISRTHGPKPEDRIAKPKALFYCLTKSDLLFTRKIGDEAPIHSRLENNFKPYKAWSDSWTPGEPFDNTFLIRNPGVANAGLFTYATNDSHKITTETGLTEDFQSYLDDVFTPMFFDEPLVRQHIGDPREKLAAVLALNDGGTSLLADALAPVCNPDLKYAQIEPRVAQLRKSVSAMLETHYETGDIAVRVAQRTARIDTLIKALRTHWMYIGAFIADFQINPVHLETAYREFRRAAVKKDISSDPFAMFDDDFGTSPSADQKKQRTFGDALVDRWVERISDVAKKHDWATRLGITEEVVRGFAEELAIASERQDLAQTLVRNVDKFTSDSMQIDAAARRISIFAADLLNDAVNYPGGRDSGREKGLFRPLGALLPAGEPPISLLSEDEKVTQHQRLGYFVDWMKALRSLTHDNASWANGGTVDVVANEQLGKILSYVGKS